MMGYQCVSTRSPAQRVCLRECTTRNTDAQNTAICNWGFNDEGSSPKGDQGFPFVFRLADLRDLKQLFQELARVPARLPGHRRG